MLVFVFVVNSQPYSHLHESNEFYKVVNEKV